MKIKAMSREKAFVIIGIISIVLAVAMFLGKTGSYESNQRYGGDAYTGIQQAAAQSANNTQYLATITKYGFGYVLLIAGLTLIAIGACDKSSSDDSATNTATDAADLSDEIVDVETDANNGGDVSSLDVKLSYVVCPKCGSENKEKNLHCLNCGASLKGIMSQPDAPAPEASATDTVEPPKIVSRKCVCGTRSYENICPNCGRQLNG